MGGLFGDAEAIYFATLAGDVARVGTPRAATPGGPQVGITSGFTRMGWRVVP